MIYSSGKHFIDVKKKSYRYKNGISILPRLRSLEPFPLKKTLVNPLNAELNPFCHFLALAGAHHFVDVSRIRVKGGGKRTFVPFISP
jgi:hypothetical protein